MADVLRGFSGKWAFLVAYTLSAGVAVLAFVLVPGPRLAHSGLIPDLGRVDATLQAVFFVGATSVLAFVSGGLSALFYRPLEGYPPFPFRNRLICRMRPRRADLLKTSPYRAYEAFPVDEADVMPTRLGNAIRAFETYSYDHYQFDTIRLWPHLSTVAPPWLQAELDYSRAPVDFFVTSFWYSIGIGLVAMAVVVYEQLTAPRWFDHPDIALIAWTVGLMTLGPALAYRAAIEATGYWANTVRALADLGRKPLAAALGLKLPATFEDERRMWAAFYRLNYYPYGPQALTALDRFRDTPASETTTAPDREPPTSGTGDGDAPAAPD